MTMTLTNDEIRQIVQDNASFGPKAYLVSVVTDLCRYTNLTKEQAQAKLWELHRAGVIRLSRADLVPSLNRAALAASEYRRVNATFHFAEAA